MKKLNMSNEIIQLSELTPFAKGGNRLCFVHPSDNNLCIKVRRPDFSLTALKKTKPWWKQWRPISWFDDNLEEWNNYHKIMRICGEKSQMVISKQIEFVQTDFGLGLVSSLIRDDNGSISLSLQEHIWRHGLQNETALVIDRFIKTWTELAIPSRNLLLHNLVVQCDDLNRARKIVVIDGLGSPQAIKTEWLPKHIQTKKAAEKASKLYFFIGKALINRVVKDQSQAFWQQIHSGD